MCSRLFTSFTGVTLEGDTVIFSVFSKSWKKSNMKVRVSLAIPLLRALTNPYNCVIFTFHASNSQLHPWSRKVEEKVRLVFQSIGGGTKPGRTFPKPWNKWVRMGSWVSCPGAGRGTVGWPLWGDAWLQMAPGNTLQDTVLRMGNLTVSICLHYSSLFPITKKSYSFFPSWVCFASDGDWQEIHFSLPWSMTFSILSCPLSCWGGALREQRVEQPEPAKVSPPQISLVFWVFSVTFRYRECSLN